MLIEPSPLVERVIGCGIRVHRQLGPGLLESAYSGCLFEEFVREGLSVEREVPVPLPGTLTTKRPFKADFLVEADILVEVKAVAALTPLHVSQVRTYLRLLNKRQGLLMNFNVRLLKQGLKRVLSPHA